MADVVGEKNRLDKARESIQQSRIGLAMAVLYLTQEGQHAATLPVMDAIAALYDFEDFVNADADSADTVSVDGATN